ncbi:MAG: ABC transporter permease [Bryobacteraceae bacterium]|nr:ABC transporter permease [Bryobacteraceae bacterium]
MVQDLRQSLRNITAFPLFSSIVVLSLALGIGANTAVFSLLDQAILQTLPVKDPQRIVVFHGDSKNLRGTASSDNYESVFSLDMAKQFRARTDLFDGVAVRGGMPRVVLNGANNEYVAMEAVSGNLFSLLGVEATLGRAILPEDDGAPGERPVAMLTHSSWLERFGGDPKIVGQTIRLNGLPFTVVGVLPATFCSAVRGNKPDVVVPISMQRQLYPDMDGTARDVRWVNLFARLKPGVSAAQATSAMQPTWIGILEGLSSVRGKAQDDTTVRRIEVIDGSRGINPLNRSLRTPLLILMGTVATVLLIACVNIAGLLLARAAARQRDIAIRLSLGAGRLRILRQSLVENFVLAAAGCGLGLVLASAMTQALLKLATDGDSTLARRCNWLERIWRGHCRTGRFPRPTRRFESCWWARRLRSRHCCCSAPAYSFAASTT